ncbi:MAG: cytochrome c biogenesis CcdA family protein [Moraxellaceae bacterium]|nr:cytochrome c biogenesis CcdA family protein [Moraxellaceae bacterium]MDZ4385739.1 cytochrome c biogenesis CcdA family protein [Moraxellaceae bacterium]
MTLELLSIPLALLAGALSILSPCVWPLVPVVMSSAATGGRYGPLALAAGLSTSFAVAGTLLSFMLLNLGLDPLIFRTISAVLLVFVGLTLIVKPLSEWLILRLSLFTRHFQVNESKSAGVWGQFAVGGLLGLVWLPCVGPTLGAAIALASVGEDMTMAFVVMFTFGVGTAAVLIVAGQLSSTMLSRIRPGMLQSAKHGKHMLGILLLILGVMVLSGIDKQLEIWALSWLPDWAVSL